MWENRHLNGYSEIINWPNHYEGQFGNMYEILKYACPLIPAILLLENTGLVYSSVIHSFHSFNKCECLIRARH